MSQKVFLNKLLEVVSKLSSIAKAQGARFEKLWNDYFKPFNENPHKIRQIPLNEKKFLEDIDYRIDILKKIEQSMVDGFYSIKSILETLYNSYFKDSELFTTDFKKEDQLILKYIAAREILGNLVQYNRMDHDSVPLKFNIMARNYLLLKLQGQKDTEIIENMKKLNIDLDLTSLQKIMNEIEVDGLISASKQDKNSYYNLKKKLELSEEGNKQYNRNLYALIAWPTQFWRSYYNIRELNVTVNDEVKHHDFLHKILSKSATQGFGPANFVFKNLVKYYEQIKEETK